MMKSKILSVILACLMVLSVMPVGVFAEEHDHDHELEAVTCPGADKHTLENAVDPVKLEGEIVQPTCTEPGGQVYICSACETRFIADFDEYPALGHNYVDGKGSEPTCTTPGMTAGSYCDRCGDVKDAQDVIPPLGHTMVDDKAVAATCTTTGLTAGKHCSECDYVETAQEVTPALGHEEYVVSVAAPAAGQFAVVTYGCTRCDFTRTAEVECTNHNADVTIPPVAPTCTETGLTAGKGCSICGAVVEAQQKVPALGHTEETDKAVAPTCTETGLTEGKHCSVCNVVTVPQEIVKALGHTEEEIPAVKGTCTEKGKTAGTKCSVCDEILVAPVETDYDHHFVKVYTFNATCTEKGYTTWKCDKLGCDEENHNIESDPLGHDWVEIVEFHVDPTCTEKGSATYECANCGDEKVEPINALGHDITTIEVPGNCVTQSYKVDSCNRCFQCVGGKYDLGETDPDKHFYTRKELVNDSTCYELGQELVECMDCGHIAILAIEKKAHSYGEWVVTQAPGCATAGIDTRTCTVCGASETRPSAPSGLHVPTAVPPVAPTCTETGLTAGEKCSVCDKVLVAQLPVDALGHTEVVDAAVAPDCTTAGKTEGKHCTVCNVATVPQEPVKALGHKAVTDAAVAPTCINSGLTEGEHCSVCNAVLKAQNVIPALCEGEDFNEHFFNFNDFESVALVGHAIDIDNPIKFVPKTCTTDGYHIYMCENCNKQVVIFELAGHMDVEVDAAVAPTCTTEGLTEGSHCNECGEIVVAQQPVKALGHTKETDKAVAPTCTETGLTEGQHCSVCNTVLVKQDVVDALGHTKADDKAVAPTCTETGLTAGVHCSVCDTILVPQLEVPELGHDITVGGLKPTCTMAGFFVDTCSRCDYEFHYGYLAPLGHTEVVDAAVAATCLATGLTEGKHCSVCKVILVAQETTDKLDHENKDGEKLETSCTNAAVDRNCVNGCGAVITPDHAEFVTRDHAPTCVLEGYLVTYCPDCGHIAAKEVYAQATGHHFDYDAEPVETVPADCLNKGVNYFKCSDCDERSEVEIPALGHDFNTEYTYDKDYHWHVCARETCVAIDEKIAHVFGAPVIVEPTLTTAGSKTWTCDCGYKYSEMLTLGEAVEFTFDIKNDLDIAGEGLVNSSLIAVTVVMKGYNEAMANGVSFKVNYNKDAVVFEGYEFVNANFDGDRYAWMGVHGVVDHGTYVNVAANLADYTADAAISADGEALVVLYFRVNTKTLAGATFSFSDVEVNVADTEAELVKAYDKASSVTFSKFLDANGDGKVNMVDFNILANLIDTEEYLVNVDVNKDGVLDIENDLIPLFGFFTAENEDELLAKRPA